MGKITLSDVYTNYKQAFGMSEVEE